MQCCPLSRSLLRVHLKARFYFLLGSQVSCTLDQLHVETDHQNDRFVSQNHGPLTIMRLKTYAKHLWMYG